jgi:pimeloyl-ACP methyl ester carboxylesterase/DNA-binding CsgD family transcriptional regulator
MPLDLLYFGGHSTPPGSRLRQRIHFCTASDGVRIAYARSGDGPPLVKTAGWLTHLENEWETPVWHHWLTELSSRNTLIRYDPRGSGLSDREVDTVDLDSWVRDLEAVVDAAGLERFPLLGNCQGGPVAVAYAARHPERVTRLIVLGSYVRGAFAGPADSRHFAEAQALERLIEVGWGHDVPAFRQVFSSLLMPGAPLDRINVMTELERVSTSARTAARFWHAFHSFDVTNEITQVKAESLVMHARGDAMVPFEEGRRVASLLPGARLVTLESRNHVLQENEPAWHQFVEELHRFLQEDDAGQNNGLGQLTRREQEVLELVAQGLNNDEIAEQLFISQRTVRNHLTNIFCKLDVTRRAQAIVQAREAGLGRREPSSIG